MSNNDRPTRLKASVKYSAVVAAALACVSSTSTVDAGAGPAAPRVAAAPVTTRNLLSVLVPALRGNRAGRLSQGVLPHPGTSGFTKLFAAGGARPAFGDVTGDRVQDAAAVILATSGAGGSDQYVEVYTNGIRRRLGQFDPAAAVPAAAHAQHANVLAMRIRGQRVLVDFVTHSYVNGKPSYWSARLGWSGRRIVHQVSSGTGVTRTGLWSDPRLVLTPNRLGGVLVGSTRKAAQVAAGMYFDLSGDGYHYSSAEPRGYPHDYVGLGRYGRVRCVGVEQSGRTGQTIVTPAGVQLGDPMRKVRRVYGARAHWVPAPTGGGMTHNYGWVVHTNRGTLTFFTYSGSVITGMAAGDRFTTPNSCTG
jgi:hypothetical protein